MSMKSETVSLGSRHVIMEYARIMPELFPILRKLAADKTVCPHRFILFASNTKNTI